MPIAKIQLQDGRIARFEVPEGTTEQDVMSYVESNSAQFAAQPQEEQGFQEANRSRVANFAKGIPQGLGNALVGFTQAATNVGESAAQGIEKAIYGDVMPQQTFGSRLANQVGKLKEEQSQLPTSEKLGIGVGEVAPYLAVGRGMGLIKGSAAASALASFLSPKEDTSLVKRTGEAVEAGVEGAAIGGILKGAGSVATPIIKSQPVQKVLNTTKDFTVGLKDRLLSQFGNETASKAIAGRTIQKGLEKEGVNVKDLLDDLQKNDHDLIDALDPRFATYGKVKTALNTPENIKKVDSSLANIKQSTDEMQQSLTNMVATKQLTPEEAGQVLGRNAKKIFDRSLESRRLKADPLYTKGLNSGTKILPTTEIPLDAKTLSSLGVEKLTLGDLLTSPIAKESIATARNKAEEFAKTPGGRFYGRINEKTKPVYKTKTDVQDVITNPIVSRSEGLPGFSAPIQRDIRLGAAATDITPEYSTKVVPSKPAQYKIPDNDVRTLYALENVLTDRIGNIKLTGASKEEAALIATKKAISGLLDNANPDLAKARSIWSADTKQIMSEGKSLVGKFAKMYDEGRTDDLAKAAMNILDLPERAIKLAKKQGPEEFNQILRSSLENKFAAIKPLDDSVVGVKPFQNALFKDGGKNLKAALGDDELFNGFKKLATQLDRGQARQRLARGAMENEAKAANILTGKTSFMNRTLENVSDKLLNSPQAQSELVDYALTDQGKELLKKIAKSKDIKTTENGLIKTFVGAGLLSKDDVYKALAIAGGKNDLVDIFPDINAQDLNMSEEEIKKSILQRGEEIPSAKLKPEEVDQETKFIKNRYYKK